MTQDLLNDIEILSSIIMKHFDNKETQAELTAYSDALRLEPMDSANTDPKNLVDPTTLMACKAELFCGTMRSVTPVVLAVIKIHELQTKENASGSN